MVVNYNLFTPNETLVPGTFWVLEQLPGTVKMSDMSAHLQSERYWASYNLPLVFYLLLTQSRAQSSPGSVSGWATTADRAGKTPGSRLFKGAQSRYFELF